MNTAIKPIETVYNGYRMRSRLEARWAVFFDALGIKYEYEYDGYDLNGTWYLPDFWLPEYQYWIEIKGQCPTKEELAKVKLLESITGCPSCLFYGLPGDNDGWAYYTCSHDSGNAGKSDSDEVQWRRCPVCNSIDLNLRHHDGCHLYSEVDGIELFPSCGCTLESFKDYHRKRIFAEGHKQLMSKAQWQQYRKKPYGEYEEPTEQEFKEAIERFIAKLAGGLYPHGLAVEGVDREFHGQFSGFSTAYTAARQARFEHGEKG